jgi:hypothetical protein
MLALISPKIRDIWTINLKVIFRKSSSIPKKSKHIFLASNGDPPEINAVMDVIKMEFKK